MTLTRPGLKASSALPLILAALAQAPTAGPALAACIGTAVVTCDTAAPNPHTTTVGTGRGDHGRTVEVLGGAEIVVTNRNAISLGDDARITLAPGALVQGNAGAGGDGLFGTGKQPIEFNSNGILVIGEGARVIQRGTDNRAEAVNVHGTGNRIENHGLISAQSSAAIWFEDEVKTGPRNVVDNHGTIQQVNGGPVIGTNGGLGIDFLNQTGARVEGDLIFAGGDDNLFFFAGSTVTGSIDGGAGNNNLTLQGALGSSDTLAGALANFQTLTKDGLGRWAITGSLSGFRSTAVNRGTLALTGNNGGYAAGIDIGPEGTLEARAQSLPTTSANQDNIRNEGRLRFVQDDSGTYEGQIVGTGVVEKTGTGVTTLAPAAAAGNGWSGGTRIEAGTLAVAADKALGAASGGLSFDGGALRTTATFSMARAATLLAGGGTFEPTGATTLTATGAVSGAGKLTKAGSGTLVLAGANSYAGGTQIDAGTVQIAQDANLGAANGPLGLAGGRLRTTADIAMNRATTLGAGGGSFETLAGTELVQAGAISGAGALAKTGAGTLVLTGAASHAGGTTIAAGTLRVGDGGTSGSLAGDVANAGALVFDRSDGIEVSGVVSGAGTLTQAGSGATRLTGDNAHSGATLVAAGGLYVNGDQTRATGATEVRAGATLGGKGTIGGDVTLAGGARLAPGDLGTAPGTLTINGALALGPGAILDYAFGQANVPGGALNDLTVVGGDLTLDGTLDVTTSPGGSFDPGIYRVFDYAGRLTDNGLEIGAIPAPGVRVQTSVANQVNLVNTTGLTLNFWDGEAGPKDDGTVNGGDGFWQGTAGNSNWTEASGQVNAPFASGSFAIFTATPGTVTVDESHGPVVASGMQFAVDGYEVTGAPLTLAGAPEAIVRVGDGTAAGAGMTATISAELAGAARLTKTDLGTLVLSGTNSYTGGTQIDGGTVAVASDASLGAAAGTLGFDGGTFRPTASFTMDRAALLAAGGGTFATAAGVSLTQAGEIAGAGALTKTGAGTLVLTGAASHAGGTTIAAGTLQLGTGGTSGALAGAVTNDGILVIDHSDALALTGAISGGGLLRQQGAGTTTLSGANSYAGGTQILGGAVSVAADANLGAASGPLALDGGRLATTASFATTRATTLGDGGGTFETTGRLAHGGAISGAGGLTKTGSGTLALSGANGYAGATTVAAGTLVVNGDQSAATGATTARAGATLGGSGRIGGDVTIADGATLAPGDVGAVGTLSIAGDLSLAPGARLAYSFGAANVVGGALNDLAVVAGDLTLDGRIEVGRTPGGRFDPGVYRVISYAGRLTDNGLAIGGTPADGLHVQTSIAQQVNLVNAAGLTLNWWDGEAGPKNDGAVNGGDLGWQSGRGNDNWTEASGSLNAPFTDGAFAIFAGRPGTVAVDNGLGAVAASGMQFAVDGYLVEGEALTLVGDAAVVRVGDGTAAGAGMTATVAAEIRGAAQLVKADLGTLVLSAANGHAGGTAIRGGVLEIASDASLGAAAGGLGFDGGTLRVTGSTAIGRATTLAAGGGTFETADGVTLTQRSGITGRGGLGKAGAGTLVLLGENAFTGGTTISGGTLRIGNGGTAGSLAGDVRNDGALVFDRAGRLDFDGAISGRGTVLQAGTGTTRLGGAGRHSGATTVAAGTLEAAAAGVLSPASAHLVAAAGALDLADFDQRVARLENAGRVSLGHAAGTRLTVAGDYAGRGGLLHFSTELGGDGSPTDLLLIEGDTSGTGIVEVVNAGGMGGQTVEGIKIIDVEGASEASFTLAGNTVIDGQPVVIGGAYAYSLWKNGITDPADGDWYLRSQPTFQPGPPLVQPGVPAYEAYPQVLLALSGLPTMQERIGNRRWQEAGASGGLTEDRRAWARIEGSRSRIEPDSELVDDARYDLDVWKLQLGIDRPVRETEGGLLVAGLTAGYGTVAADISSASAGDGSIATTGYGFGGSLTWFGNDDLYLDGQAQAMWFDSDLASDEVDDDLESGNRGFGYALGVEAGRRVAVRPGWAVTPQAQLVYASVAFDDFEDTFGVEVESGDGATLPVRLGVSIDRQAGGRDAGGEGRRTHVYGIANLYHDLIGETKLTVGGTGLTNRPDRTWGSLGLGGTWSWADGQYAVYGEGLVSTSLANFGDSYTGAATAGFRIAW